MEKLCFVIPGKFFVQILSMSMETRGVHKSWNLQSSCGQLELPLVLFVYFRVGSNSTSD